MHHVCLWTSLSPNERGINTLPKELLCPSRTQAAQVVGTIPYNRLQGRFILWEQSHNCTSSTSQPHSSKRAVSSQDARATAQLSPLKFCLTLSVGFCEPCTTLQPRKNCSHVSQHLSHSRILSQLICLPHLISTHTSPTQLRALLRRCIITVAPLNQIPGTEQLSLTFSCSKKAGLAAMHLKPFSSITACSFLHDYKTYHHWQPVQSKYFPRTPKSPRITHQQ